jgi:hypothetical protein
MGDSDALLDATATTDPAGPAGGGIPVRPRVAVHDRAGRGGDRRLDPDDLVNRHLCAGVYLQGTYADHVAERLLGASPRAICPPWGVDAVWLARHATEARRLRHERDVRLAGVLACAVALTAGLLALRVVHRADVLQVAAGWVLVWTAGYAAAFVLVFGHYRTVRRTAVSLAFDPEPPAAPQLADTALEERLDALRDANTVVFSGDDVSAREQTFVGSGSWYDHNTFTVDVGKGAKLDDDERRTPASFDGYELHEYLLEKVPRGLHPAPLAGHRLYVRGSTARVEGAPVFPHGPVPGGRRELMEFRRPVNHVPPAVLRRYLGEADDGARGYTVFELRGWGGQVAVTLFVRARVVVDRTLFVEVDVLRQRQLMDVFWDVDTIRLQSDDEVPALVRSVVPAAVPVLVGSVRRLWRCRRAPRREAREVAELAKDLARHRYCNLGAGSSLRETSSSEVLTDDDRFPWADEKMFYQVLTSRLLDCIKDFLEAKGVDTSSFERQQVFFVERTTVHARDIFGTVGTNNGTTSVNTSSGSSAGGDGGD